MTAQATSVALLYWLRQRRPKCDLRSHRNGADEYAGKSSSRSELARMIGYNTGGAAVYFVLPSGGQENGLQDAV